MEITEIKRNRWSVESDSGHTYEVRFVTHLDENGSMYFTWSCDCPAGRYGKSCKHIRAVENETSSMDDQAEERIAL